MNDYIKRENAERSMNNDEAIEILKSKMDGSVDTSYEWCEAIRLAILALEEQDNEKASKEKA